MFKDLEAKTFDASKIKGISAKQIEEHLKLYKGYVTKVNELSKSDKDANNFKGSNPTYSAMRSLKLGETFALNGAILHELYFENISCTSDSKCLAHGKMLDLIEEDFCEYEAFIKYLKEAALSIRGWAIVAIDSISHTLRVIGADAHDVGALWSSYPLLVIDVYEHAYFMDFGTDRAKYLDTIIENINWEVVEKRLAKHIACCELLSKNKF